MQRDNQNRRVFGIKGLVRRRVSWALQVYLSDIESRRSSNEIRAELGDEESPITACKLFIMTAFSGCLDVYPRSCCLISYLN